jgi:hypothetical protein
MATVSQPSGMTAPVKTHAADAGRAAAGEGPPAAARPASASSAPRSAS